MILIDKMLNMESMYLPLMNPSSDSSIASMLFKGMSWSLQRVLSLLTSLSVSLDTRTFKLSESNLPAKSPRTLIKLSSTRMRGNNWKEAIIFSHQQPPNPECFPSKTELFCSRNHCKNCLENMLSSMYIYKSVKIDLIFYFFKIFKIHQFPIVPPHSCRLELDERPGRLGRQV